MNKNLIVFPYPQEADTFGEQDYGMDIEENLGFRTPFLDKDSKQSEKLFEDIMNSYRQ